MVAAASGQAGGGAPRTSAKIHGRPSAPRPRATQRTPGDHDADAVGAPGAEGARVRHVAGSDDRDRQTRGQLDDRRPVGGALVLLRTGPPVHRDQRRPALDDGVRGLGQADLVLAEPHLRRYGQAGGVPHGGDDRARQLGSGHQLHAAALVRDLSDRAAHVQVERDRRVALLELERGRRRFAGVRGEQLDHEVRLAGVGGSDQHAALIAARQRACADHLRHRPGAALFPAQPPERRVGVARHGRQHRTALRKSGREYVHVRAVYPHLPRRRPRRPRHPPVRRGGVPAGGGILRQVTHSRTIHAVGRRPSCI